MKNASAATIYGPRAANGVVLITTKKVQLGDQFRLNVSTLGSLSANSKLVPVLSADQFRDLITSNATLGATA